ncbi:hypothetical protein [Sulfitobacter mediterraneus]|uniref:hypothetical protein n=1 Tax=Sulfitobacter mediterraneus TaxID=83219 RepID=UPI0021A3551D|nr:hypothetical protein [Sulfitobacter mediterraneus]UWR10775.1 hypothetical protein K3753_16220 [Sulfitobacter mediterraneus]
MNKPLITACLMCTATAVAAADLQEMGDMSKEMVARAVTHYQQVGREQAEKDFNHKTEEWYADKYFLHMFAMNVDGTVWADNVWPEFIGTDFTAAGDFDGFEFGHDIIANTPQGGEVYQVQLKFMNPESGDLTPSVGSCVRADAQNILCSWANG